MCQNNDGRVSEESTSTRATMSRCCSIRGGTTGTPKGRNARPMPTSASTAQQRRGLGEPSRRRAASGRWQACRSFHVFAMTAVMNFALSQGAELIIMPRFVLE